MNISILAKSFGGSLFRRSGKNGSAAAELFLFLLPILSFLPTLTAQETYRSAEETRPPRELRVVCKTVYPRETTLYELSNGLTLFIRRTDGDLATVRAYIKNTGSVNERRFLGSGISHLTEHIVCGGSTIKRKEEETRQILDRLGGSFNAATGKFTTSYHIDCSTETVSTAIELMADWLTHCAVDPNEFAREKRVILQELADAENDPESIAGNLLLKTVYRENPCRHPIGGYLDLFLNLTRDDVKQFYDKHYTPNNTLFLVAGNVREEEIVGQLTHLYQDVPRGEELEPESYTEPQQIAPREAVRETAGQMFRLLLAWPTVSIDDADLCPLDVLAVLLAGGASGRLDRKLKDEKQLGFSYDATSVTPSSTPGFFLIRAETRPEELAAVQTAILDLLRQLSEVAVSNEELTRAKKITESEFIRSRETLAASSDMCVINYILTGNPDFDETYLEEIRKVSPADITRVARTYFRPERQNRVLIAPPGLSPTSITQTRNRPDSGIEGFHLQGNDLRVLAKRSSALPIVTVQIYALGGSLAESEETAGRCAMLAAMLDKGSEHYQKNTIENYFDSIGGEVSFYGGRNTLVAEMTVLKGDFKEALTVLADMFLRPGFPDNEFQKVKKNQQEKILSLQGSPTNTVFMLFSDVLPATTPYHLRIDGTAESIGKIRLDDLRRLHRQLLEPDRMIIAVFGDIDTEEAVYAVKERFSVVPRSGNPIPIPFDRSNRFVSQPDEHRRFESETGLGIIAWPTVSISNEKEYAALTVLQGVLGGYGAPGGRLFKELREAGLVYRLHFGQLTGPAPGYMYAFFETAPDKISEVFDRIEKGIEPVKGGDLPEDELNRVKEQIVAFRPRELETLADQAQHAALDDLYGLGYKYEQGFTRRIKDVSRDEVIAVAQKYLTRPAKVSISGNETRDKK
jgi:zinc protease